MSEAEELLNSLSNDATVYTSRPSEEPHIVIGDDRNIIVPESLQRIAVQFDHNVETVTFDCPRYWDDNDLSELYIYINYLRKDGVRGRYLAKNVVVDSTDSNMIHFDWTITNEITAIEGKLVFSVCAVITNDEGFEERHWNSELNTQMTISGGLECTEVIPNEYPDIVTDLISRMDTIISANSTALDTSLTQAGLAAEAKVTGDAIRELDTTIDNLVNEFEVSGKLIHIDDCEENICYVSVSGTLTGEVYHCGENLYDYKDTISVSSGITTDNDGWITITDDNTSGTAIKYVDYFTNKLKAVEPSTKYTLVIEVKSVTGNARLVACSSAGQFTDATGIEFESLTTNKLRVVRITTDQNYGSIDTSLRTFVEYGPGEKGSITFRLSILTDINITADTFIYKPHQSETINVSNLNNITTYKGQNSFVLISDNEDSNMSIIYRKSTMISYRDLEDFRSQLVDINTQMGNVTTVLNKINGEEV